MDPNATGILDQGCSTPLLGGVAQSAGVGFRPAQMERRHRMVHQQRAALVMRAVKALP